MWRHAGLLRDGEGLGQAAETVAAWRSARPETAANDSGAEDDNLLLVAEHMLAAASARTGSVGAHVRIDEPNAGPSAHRSPALIGAPC